MGYSSSSIREEDVKGSSGQSHDNSKASSLAQPTYQDYSHEVRLAQNPLLRYLWLVLGLACTALGFIGAVTPLMPSTVFFLLAAYFFARSSPKFYNWLLNHRMFGQFIRDWRAGLGMPMRVKVFAITLLTLTLAISCFFLEHLWLRVILILVGLGVSTYILKQPTKKAV